MHNIIYIFLFILVITLLYFLYRKMEANEQFDIDSTIASSIKNTYNIDLDSMRNLSQISKNLLQNNNLIIPSNNSILNNINIKENIVSNNMTISGDIELDGTCTNRNLPLKNTINFWLENQKIPLGWAPCDGRKYSVNTNITDQNPNNYILDNNGFLTPNLTAYNNYLSIKNQTRTYSYPQDKIIVIVKII